MKQEIERKFLIDHEKWAQLEKGNGVELYQGYLVAEPSITVRVRIAGPHAFLTIKGKTTGASRAEYEYEIPLEEASELLDNLATSSLSKVRYEIEYDGKIWEVDVFKGANEGLIVAEIELLSEEEPFEKPDWVTEEVTGDNRYYNSQLAEKPFKSWPGE